MLLGPKASEVLLGLCMLSLSTLQSRRGAAVALTTVGITMLFRRGLTKIARRLLSSQRRNVLDLKMPVPPDVEVSQACLLYTSPSPRDLSTSRMPSSA